MRRRTKNILIIIMKAKHQRFVVASPFCDLEYAHHHPVEIDHSTKTHGTHASSSSSCSDSRSNFVAQVHWVLVFQSRTLDSARWCNCHVLCYPVSNNICKYIRTTLQYHSERCNLLYKRCTLCRLAEANARLRCACASPSTEPEYDLQRCARSMGVRLGR